MFISSLLIILGFDVLLFSVLQSYCYLKCCTNILEALRAAIIVCKVASFARSMCTADWECDFENVSYIGIKTQLLVIIKHPRLPNLSWNIKGYEWNKDDSFIIDIQIQVESAM